jgi:metallo-beta-lactamase family protein
MKLKFIGAAETVTGSKFLLESNNNRTLIDCGLFQGYKKHRLRNWEPFPVPPSSIHSVVLTHAHLDHTGYLPILVREGFKGPIYATAATRDLCEILLRDAARIQEEDARRANKYGYSVHKPALPLYTEKEAIDAMLQFKTFGFGVDIPIGKDLVVHASRAGHILGSAILTFRSPEASIVFTGDLGRPYDPIMMHPATIHSGEYLVLESTYGNRLHPKLSAEDELGAIIRDTASKGGTVVIPSFAVGRSQTILYILYQLKKQGKIPSLPIYLDSPMAQDATMIMQQHSSEHRLSKELSSKVCSIAEYVRTTEDSKRLHKNKLPSIIISASGMAEGGRVLHHISHFGPDHHNAIVFAGFQAPMTRGERIISGAKEVKIHGSLVPIRARVENLESLSSHADADELLKWLGGFSSSPRKVFLVHGEEASLNGLKQRIEDQLGWNVAIPYYLEEVEL